MTNVPPEDKKDQIEEATILSQLTYLKFDVEADGSKTVNEIMKKAKGDPTEIDIIKSYIKQNPDFGNLVLIDQSMSADAKSSGLMTDPKGFIGYTFQDPTDKNKVFIVFSGTPANAWGQNGDPFGPPRDNKYYNYETINGETVISGTKIINEHFSESQATALNYLNYVAEKHGLTEDHYVTVTGHSQGDNSAKTVTMRSDLIDLCVGIDGQGYSPEAIAEMQKDPKYNERIDKIYQVRNDNNGVDGFGLDICNPNQVFYQKGPLTRKILAIDHELKNHFVITGYDDDGAPIYGFADYTDGRGFVGKTMENFSNILKHLPQEVRGPIARGVMQIAQLGLQKLDGKSAFGNPAELWEVILAYIALEVVLPIAALAGAFQTFGISGEFVLAYIGIVIFTGLLIFAPIILITVGVAVIIIEFAKTMISLADFAIKKIIEIGSELLQGLYDSLVNMKNGFEKFLDTNFNIGYQYALANPLLVVDTVRMRDYASRLTKVNNRVKNVDNRISKLYGKVIKIEDLIGSAQRLSKLIRANVLLGNSPKLTKSAEYLNNAATDFETAEKKIRAKKI